MIDAPIGLTRTGGRSFPLAFRIEFIRQWDSCIRHGTKVQLLREYAVSSSTVRRWLNARDAGDWEAAMVKEAAKGPRNLDARDRAELARLRQENEVLKNKVNQAEAAQQILGKAFELLEGITQSSDPDAAPIPPALMSANEYQNWLTRRKLS